MPANGFPAIGGAKQIRREAPVPLQCSAACSQAIGLILFRKVLEYAVQMESLKSP